MKSQMKPLLVLFVTLFLVMLGFGILIPVLPFYVRHFGGNARTLGLLLASYSVMQFFFAPLWGRLSDRIGRRPVLLIGLSGYAITFILYGLSTHLWMLFAARILAGLISSATLPTAMAYVADITTPEDRARGMGLMGAAIGLGIITGPAVGGLVGEYGLSLPFFVAGGVALINFPFAWAYLPETLKRDSSRPAAPPTRLSWQIVRHPQFPLFLLALTVSFTMTLFESTFALFSHDRLGLSARDMGIMFAVLGVFGVGLQGGGLGRLARRFGDVSMIVGAMALSALGFVLMLQASSVPLLWIFTAVFSLSSSVMRPILTTLVTRTSDEGRGAIVGIQQSFDSLGRILGPALGGVLYEAGSSYPYMIGAATLALVLVAVRPRLESFR